MNGKRITLECVDRYQENVRWFYIVNFKGSQYKVRMYNFQVHKPGIPKELNCIVTEFPSYVKISQDRTTLIQELYKVGECYTFRVKNKLTNYYSVVDINGLRFSLSYSSSDHRLTEGQSVVARVKSIDGMKVRLELSRSVEAMGVPFKSVDDISSEAHLPEGSAELLSSLLSTRPEMTDTKALYEANDALWVFDAARNLDFIMKHHSADVASEQLLALLKRLCVYLLEESDLLRRMTDVGRDTWIKELTTVAGDTEINDEAYSIIARGEGRDYVIKQLQNLRESENLYRPEHKLRIIMIIFNRDDALMSEMTDTIFDIILKGNKEHWLAEPFRSAFVNMLEIFIAAHRRQAGLSPSSPIAQKMIKAIAIQLLLSKNEDDIDRRLNRATYYRLLATQQNYDSENILNDAFNSLFSDYDDGIEYDWDDIASVDGLYIKASVHHRKALSADNFDRQVYRNDRNELIVDDDRLTIQPVIGRHSSLLPSALLSWHNLDIHGSYGVKTKFKNSSNLNTAVSVWHEIEENLAHKPLTGLYKKAMPEVGDVVVVRITDSSDDNEWLYCEIDDEHYEGHGWIFIKNVAQFMGKNDRNLSYFSDEEDQPLAFEVVVTKSPDDNGDFEFSMADIVNEHFRQLHYVGDELLCNVRDVDKYNPNSFVGFSLDGASCIIKSDGTLRLEKNDIVRIRLVQIANNGQYICEYIEHSPHIFNIIDAIKNLLSDISLDAPQQQALPEEQMDDDVLTELIGILDRHAVCAPSRVATYGFLSLAGIMAQMMGDETMMSYYDERRTLVKLFNDYETTGRMDEKRLQEIEEHSTGDAAGHDFYINEALTKFRILSALRHKANIEELFDISRTTSSTAIRNAADMTIALLLTQRFELSDFKTQLEDRINRQLGINIKTSTLKDYGIETQEIEFKSSIIYPAGGHMQAAPTTQEAVIMRVICGFLNSDKGGRLYLGVNKAGTACGVQNDMRFLDNADEDAYGRYVHNMINRNLGSIANQCCIDSSWEEDQGYKIYVINIKPSPELISYAKVYWIRQDTETRPLREDNIETYAKMHTDAYQKLMHPEATTEAIVTDSVSQKVKDDTTNKVSKQDQISTNKRRRNVVLDYEDNYGDGTVAYLHLLDDNKYMVTDDGIYQETLISLAIQEEEADGYLLIGYESGRILLVEMSSLLNKTRDRRYQRCKGERPIYACPLRQSDLVMTEWESTRGETLIRVDDISDLISRHIDGTMNSEGAFVCDTKFNRFITCDIVKAEDKQKLQKFRNQGDGLGQKITSHSLADMALLRDLLSMNFD